KESSPVAYAVSRRSGDAARARVEALLVARDAGPGVTAAWFASVSRHAEDASRSYASAFRATDATSAEKVAVVLEAAEGALALARRLDALGLDAMPAAWRADPTLAVTFEDV